MSDKKNRLQIPPIEYLDMDADGYLGEDNSDIEAMLGFFNEASIENTAPKIVPKTRKLRVKIKRLPPAVVKKYIKMKPISKVGFSAVTSKHLVKRLNPTPLQRQMLKKLPTERLKDIEKTYLPTKTSSVASVQRNNLKQHSQAGQSLSTTLGPEKQKSNCSNSSKKNEVNIVVRRSLPNGEKKITTLKSSEIYTKNLRVSPQKTFKALQAENNADIMDDTKEIQVKKLPVRKESNNTNKKDLRDYFSSKNQQTTSAISTPKNARIVNIPPANTLNRNEVISNILKSIRKKESVIANKDKTITIKSNDLNISRKSQQYLPIKSIEYAHGRDDKKPIITSNNTKLLTNIKKELPTTSASINEVNKNLIRRLTQQSVEVKSVINKNLTNNPVKCVKDPNIIKVPISILNKLPLEKRYLNTLKHAHDEKKPNINKSFERVNISKVVYKNSVQYDLKSSGDKMPESPKLLTQVKSEKTDNQSKNNVQIPQTIKISKDLLKALKQPNAQNVTGIKTTNSKANTSVDKAPQKVISTKTEKITEVDLTTENIDNKCKTIEQSQPTQTEKEDREKLTKSTQTKFTCGDNVCGIIDTAEFTISCFYCYDVFTLPKWTAFVKHMKTFHRLNEKSQKVADKLLDTKFITPHGTKSKMVQVNTLRGKDVLGKRKREEVKDKPDVNAVKREHIDSICDDDSHLENDLEMALNGLQDDTAEKKPILKPMTSTPLAKVKLDSGEKKIVTLNAKDIKPTVQQISPIPNKIMRYDLKKQDSLERLVPKMIVLPKSSVNFNLNLAGNPMLKNRIITLPPNIKIIKKLPANTNIVGNTIKPPVETVTTKEIAVDDKNKTLVVKQIKNEIPPEPQMPNNSNMDSMDSFTNDIIEQLSSPKAEDFAAEWDESHLDDIGKEDENNELNISEPDDEQNVQIEPDFNNKNTEDTALLRLKDLEKRCKKIIGPQKQLTANLKQKPIPSNLLDSDDEMPSDDENEDEFPSPTNGCGILFGLTNRNIVKEFIKELQKYPELYQFNRNNDVNINYGQSIRRLYQHLNNKFKLEMTDFEIRLSIQRVKFWYCRTLQKMERHDKDPQKNQMSFRHSFSDYFQMLSKFLTYDSNCAKDLILGRRFQKKDVNELNRYPKWMLYKDPTAGEISKDDNLEDVKKFQFSDDEMIVDELDEEGLSIKAFKGDKNTSNGLPPEPFICDICFGEFNKISELQNHRLRHFPPEYSCAKCKCKHFTSQAADKCLHNKNEQSQDSESGQYMCEICGVSYKSMGTLNYHKKDKHFNMRLKCPVCRFTSISNCRMLQHQKLRHVVEFGTCEQLNNKTRSRNEKMPMSIEGRRELQWRSEMKKTIKPGQLFHGCYKCKMVFETRKEKIQHNRKEHPITEATVVCVMCPLERSLFCNINAVRRHYTDIHKVTWDEIDDVVKRTKRLFDIFTPQQVDELKSNENPFKYVAQILTEKQAQATPNNMDNEISNAIKSISEDFEEELNQTYDPFEKYTKRNSKKFQNNDEEDSMDDDCYQSTFFNDIGIDDEMINDPYFEGDENADDGKGNSEDDDYDFYNFETVNSHSSENPNDSNQVHYYEYQDEEGNESYIIEEVCLEDGQEVFNKSMASGQESDDLEISKNEESIVEEIVEYDIMDYVMN